MCSVLRANLRFLLRYIHLILISVIRVLLQTGPTSESVAAPRGKFSFPQKTKNTRYAWGRDSQREKDSLPPPYFPRGVRTDAAVMKGMLKRWFQVTPSSHIVLRCAWQKTAEYLLAGYSIRYMRTVWGSLPDSYVRREVFRLLDSAKTASTAPPSCFA